MFRNFLFQKIFSIQNVFQNFCLSERGEKYYSSINMKLGKICPIFTSKLILSSILLQSRALFIDRSRIPVNKGIKSRFGWTKDSDLYEIVHQSIVNWVEWLWNPWDSFVICFCGPESAQRSKEFLSFWLYWPVKTLH